MKQIDSTYSPLANLLLKSEVAIYPEDSEHTVVLGSLLKISDRFSPDPYSALVVGVASLFPERYATVWQEDGYTDELTIVGVEAPLGKAVISHVAGDLVTVINDNGSSYDTSIVDVDNAWLLNHARQLM